MKSAEITADATLSDQPVMRSRRKRRRKPILGIGPRLLILAGVGLVALAICAAIISKLVQPYQMQHQQAKQIHQLQAQLASNNDANNDLQRQIAYLKRPDGVETAARAEGFMKPGEVSLEVNAKAVPKANAQSQSGFSGMIRRAWSDLTHH